MQLDSRYRLFHNTNPSGDTQTGVCEVRWTESDSRQLRNEKLNKTSYHSELLTTEPKITILDWLVKCPAILNFAWIYKKFSWTQFFRKMHSIAHVILVTYKLTRVLYKYLGAYEDGPSPAETACYFLRSSIA